jgi:Ca2+-binding RTX toxin-like protein
VDPDGKHIAFVGTDGVHVVDISSGARVVSGTAGDDMLTGGHGNNTFVVNTKGDVVTEAQDAGYDNVRSSIHKYTLTDNVERLELVGTADNGYGNKLDNTIVGNDGANTINGFHGQDSVFGGAGDDVLRGAHGNDVLDGGAGDDTMQGGFGSDRYIVDSSHDVIVEDAGHAIDTVEASVSYTLPDNVEILLLMGTDNLSGTGNEGNNQIIGTIGDNVLRGQGGDDVLEAGGGGADLMIGGTGADTFRFVQLDGSGASFADADVIRDFSSLEGDKVDLSAIDSDVVAAGDQAFTFLGHHAFTRHAGELRWQHFSGDTYVEGDVNGDTLIDFVIKLHGKMDPVDTDFIL